MVRVALIPLLISLAATLAADEVLTFEQHIRPIFRAHCFDCHGATDTLEGGLDLRQVRLIKQGGDSGPAIDLADFESSYLLERIRSGEMPPGEHRVAEEEIEIIAAWLASGAGTARPEPEQLGPGLGITPEEREFWAFQPIRRPAVPALQHSPRPAVPAASSAPDPSRSPIDVLVTAQRSAALAPEAPRHVLIQRAYFDLIGLPPEPELLTAWMSDPRPDWYDRLLTELLSSQHYGERWGRHWLDVAGYADSEGATADDAIRPWAWKYRDWVIRALNQDKPFDQFIIEQLAGDELAGPRQGDWTPAQIDLLTATGFLRMAADGTGSGANDPSGRNQVIADTLKIIGTSLFGMSIQCAQCHDHRYDPIPQSDYYALRAVFEPALDWNHWQTPEARRVSLYTAADHQQAAQIEAEAQRVSDQRAATQAAYMQQALEAELNKFAEPLRTELRQAYETPAADRSEPQQQLLSDHPSVNITPGNLYQYIPESKEKLTEIDQQISQIRSRKPPHEFVRALVEPPGQVTETRLFHRGDHEQPKQVVEPGPLSVVTPPESPVTFPADDESLPTTGRRLAFARWLTGPDNPLLARVIANRVWMHHFGTGLVATPADFGKLGARPAHPQLLDWLADELIRGGWSLKHLHRVIMRSSTYRQSVTTEADNRPLRRSLRRLEAETIRDRILAATGALDRGLFGPPLQITADETGQVLVSGDPPRRSVYIQVRRSQPVALLQTFDAPVMETNCEVRDDSIAATQSLMLLNSQFILDQAAQLADRVVRDSGSDPSPAAADRHIERAWQLAYGRPPTADEAAQARQFCLHQEELFATSPAAVPTGRTASQQTLTNLCQILLSSNEFLYVE